MRSLDSPALHRYDLVAAAPGGGGGGAVAPCGQQLGTRPKPGQKADAPPKTRYHNGEIVSRSGEKYVVEKARV
jgi:hypothetical protein